MGKVGGTVDRRFGENDPTLDPEAKSLARMARIRAKQLGRRGTFAIGGAHPALLPSLARTQPPLSPFHRRCSGANSPATLDARELTSQRPAAASDDDDGEGDDDGDVLTHMGQSLNDMDDFSNPSDEARFPFAAA